MTVSLEAEHAVALPSLAQSTQQKASYGHREGEEESCYPMLSSYVDTIRRWAEFTNIANTFGYLPFLVLSRHARQSLEP